MNESLLGRDSHPEITLLHSHRDKLDDFFSVLVSKLDTSDNET